MKIKKLVLPLPKQYSQPGYYCFYKPLGAKCYRLQIMDVVDIRLYAILVKYGKELPMQGIFFVPEHKKEFIEHLILKAGIENVLWLKPEPSFWN